MYQKIECAVKIGSQHTSFFKCPRGVRQGCPLSPTFFNIYINDLAEKMNDANNTPLNFGNENISCLMYADDLIILSLTHRGLQNCLDALSNYCNEWRLVINKSKSKCTTFHKRNKKYNKAFLIDNTPLENVTDYTYLGLNIDASCSFNVTHKLLASKANRTIFALNSRFKLKLLPVKAALKLFDSTISSILFYGSEVWGAYENLSADYWDKNDIEKVHTQFLKRILGVNRSTANILVRGELGQYPLSTQINTRNANFLKHRQIDHDQNTFAHQVLKYEKSVKDRTTVTTNITQLTDDSITSKTKASIKNTFQQQYQKKWYELVQASPKALVYKSYKNSIRYEQYLSMVQNRFDRRIITKLRLSDHCLAIESGRHTKPQTPREKRFCKECPNKIEDETHFILSCPSFSSERNTFLESMQMLYPNFSSIPTDNQKMIFLSTNEDGNFLSLFSQYLTTIYKKRQTNQEKNRASLTHPQSLD